MLKFYSFDIVLLSGCFFLQSPSKYLYPFQFYPEEGAISILRNVMGVYCEIMGNVQNTSRLLQYIASSEILPPEVQQRVFKDSFSYLDYIILNNNIIIE